MSSQESIDIIQLEGQEYEPLPFVYHHPEPIQIPPAQEDEPFAPPSLSPIEQVFEGGWGPEYGDEDSEGSLFDLLNLNIPVPEEWSDLEDDLSTVLSIWEGFHDLWNFMSDSEAETVVEGWEGYLD